MNIEIHDAAIEARIRKQLQATGSANLEEVLLHLLETQEQQDRWLLENRKRLTAKLNGASINSIASKESPRINCTLIWQS
jgi:hypothetical protein